MQMVLRWLVSALALYLTVRAAGVLNIPGFWVAPGIRGAQGLLVTALALGVINAVLRPLLQMFTLPLTCLTFGLFALVLNALLFWLAGQAMPGLFHVRGWAAPLFGSLVMGVIAGPLNALLASDREKERR